MPLRVVATRQDAFLSELRLDGLQVNVPAAEEHLRLEFSGGADVVRLEEASAAFRSSAPAPSSGTSRWPRPGSRLGSGSLSSQRSANVLNPKTALFFLAFLPQFVDPARTLWTQVVVLGLSFVVLGFVSDGLYAVAAGSATRWLHRRRRALGLASGGVYVALRVTTALA